VSPGSNPWGHNKRSYPFTLSFLSPLSFHPASFLLKPVVKLPLPLFTLSHIPWRFKDSTKEKPQDFKEKDLPRLLH
jgi:hypothetical protein